MTKRAALARAVFGAFAGLLVASCDPAPPVRPGAVLLLTIDTLPASRVGCYGSVQVRTPHLDRLARTGLQVRDAISPAPLTLPSHATMLTGVDPPFHGIRENGLFELQEGLPTLGELLPEGTASAAFVAAMPLKARFGLDRGFDLYDDDLPPSGSEHQAPERTAEEVYRRAADWLASEGAGAPVFVWAHVFDPHYPYEAPAPWPEVAATIPGAGRYDAEVTYTDRQLGRFLREVRALPGTGPPTVLLVADHGEALGRHGELTHALLVYDATQRVPMVLSGPGIAAGIGEEQRTFTDIAPTLLSLFGKSGPGDGTPLTAASATRHAYVETKHTELMRGWSPLHGIRTREWKYILAPRPELYDLVADPAELENVHDSRPEVVERLAAVLGPWLTTGGEEPGSLDDETAESLRSLGYLARIEPGSAADLGKDPKDGLESAAALFRGQEAFIARKYVAAERYLTRAIELDPEAKEAFSYLSGARLSLRDYAGAVEAARRALELPPHFNEVPIHVTLGEALLTLGRPDEALPHLRAAAREKPRDERIAGLLARAEREIR